MMNDEQWYMNMNMKLSEASIHIREVSRPASMLAA